MNIDFAAQCSLQESAVERAREILDAGEPLDGIDDPALGESIPLPVHYNGDRFKLTELSETFPNDYEAIITVTNGEPPYVDGELQNENGKTVCTLSADGDRTDLTGPFYFTDDQGRQYEMTVEETPDPNTQTDDQKSPEQSNESSLSM